MEIHLILVILGYADFKFVDNIDKQSGNLLENYSFRVFFGLLLSFGAALFLLWPSKNAHFSFLLTHKSFYFTFTTTFYVCLELLIFVTMVCDFLDKRYKWEDGMIKRLVMQVLLGFTIPLAGAIILAYICFYIQHRDMVAIYYSRHLFGLILCILFIFNTISCTYKYILKHAELLNGESFSESTVLLESRGSSLERIGSSENVGLSKNISFSVNIIFSESRVPSKSIVLLESGKQFPEYIWAKFGKEKIRLNVNQIAYFQLIGRFVLVSCIDGSEYTSNLSITYFASLLQSGFFLQVNRTFIITPKSLSRIQERGNGGLFLYLKHKRQEVKIQISREKTKYILDWIGNEPGLVSSNSHKKQVLIPCL